MAILPPPPVTGWGRLRWPIGWTDGHRQWEGVWKWDREKLTSDTAMISPTNIPIFSHIWCYVLCFSFRIQNVLPFHIILLFQWVQQMLEEKNFSQRLLNTNWWYCRNPSVLLSFGVGHLLYYSPLPFQFLAENTLAHTRSPKHFFMYVSKSICNDRHSIMFISRTNWWDEWYVWWGFRVCVRCRCKSFTNRTRTQCISSGHLKKRKAI